MKKINFIVFLLLTNITFAQKSSWIIQGKVVDELNKPISFALVYINNSSISTEADSVGNFRLSIPKKYNSIELLASFVGFRPEMLKLNRTANKLQNITFNLHSVNILAEVSVIAKMDKHWKRKWRMFENALLGDSEFTKSCKILNPEVIKLDFDDKSKWLKAYADKPIEIENKGLGYIIHFQMIKFETDGKKTYLSGYKHFEELNEKEEKIANRFINNRKKAYQNSFRNFLVSLIENKLEENRFEVYQINQIREMFYGRVTLENDLAKGVVRPVTVNDIMFYDESKELYFLYSKKPLLVFIKTLNNYTPIYVDYAYQFSQITLPYSYCGFTKNGWLVAPNGIIIHNFWGNEGLSNLLPDDYAIQNTLEDSPPLPTETLKPKEYLAKSDSIAMPTKLVILNKGNDNIKTETKNIEGVTALSLDYLIHLEESDFSKSIYDLLRKIPGLRVYYNSVSHSYYLSFLGSNTNLSLSTDANYTPALLINNQFYGDSESVYQMLESINVRDITAIGAIKYGNNAAFGARGGNGTIVIMTKN